MSKGNLFVQGNAKNEWFKAYPWQNIFLKEDSFKLTKTHYHHAGDFVYVNIPISTEENIPCENLKNVAISTGIFEIEKFKSKPLILWMWDWISSKDQTCSENDNEHKPNLDHHIISAGFLCNLTTGTSRMYIITEEEILMLKHNGLKTISSPFLEEYRKKYEEIMF